MSGLLPDNWQSLLAFAPATVANRIRECIEAGWTLLNARATGPGAFSSFRANRSKWDDQNREVLRRLFKSDALRTSYDKVGQVPSGPASPATELERLRDSVSDKLSLLQAILDELDGPAEGASRSPRVLLGNMEPVFVVHVDEPALARSVARILEGYRYAPVLVSNRPGEDEIGVHTLESYRDALFGIVIMAGDLVPGQVNDKGVPSRTPHAHTVLWLGYLAGRLGRNRACALYQPGLPRPGREMGIHAIEFDEGGAWKEALGKRLEGVRAEA